MASENEPLFSAETIDFLIENCYQNSREWFWAHHKEYEDRVLHPMRALADRLSGAAEAIDPAIMTDPRSVVSHINRDLRYSANQSLYRDYMWLGFKRDKKSHPHYPEIFFGIMPDGICIGCGCWQMEPDAMAALRRSVLDDTPEFRAVSRWYASQTRFAADGRCYKRTKFPDEPESRRFWLDRRELSFIRRCTDFEEVYSAQLPDIIERDMMLLQEAYRWFLWAVENN